MSCKHTTRTAKGDYALANPESLRDDLPDYRRRVPEFSHLTDDEIIERMCIYIASIPRYCPECSDKQPS